MQYICEIDAIFLPYESTNGTIILIKMRTAWNEVHFLQGIICIYSFVIL